MTYVDGGRYPVCKDYKHTGGNPEPPQLEKGPVVEIEVEFGLLTLGRLPEIRSNTGSAVDTVTSAQFDDRYLCGSVFSLFGHIFFFVWILHCFEVGKYAICIESMVEGKAELGLNFFFP